MEFIKDIRRLYKPVQPVVKQRGEQVTYCEFLPDPALQEFIYCYWQLKTEKPLEKPFSYCVVADGCIDIYFELKNSRESYVMGFCKKYTEFQLGRNFDYVGVRFLPSMFPQLFGVNASTLSNRDELLRLILPETADYIESTFDEELPAGEVKKRFDDYFIRYLANKNLGYDLRFYRALSVILNKRGLVDLETDLDTGISERQLRRLFEFYIGTSPKTFSQVVRFQRVLQAKPSSRGMKQDKLFFEAGYYDQAHFIKEFKTFYGITPGQAFER